MNRVLSILGITSITLFGIIANVAATEPGSLSNIPDGLISPKRQRHDSSLASSVDAVRYKLKRNQSLTLVDVRPRQDFERLHIPGSINIPLYAVKTKTYLKSAPIVLVNAGFRYDDLAIECRRLAALGFEVSILDGGLPAWKLRGGQLVGDLFALDEMKAVSPQTFFRAKNYENTTVIDISPNTSAASRRLMPFAKHIPVPDSRGRLKSELRKLLKKNQPFQSIIVFNEFGDQYDQAAMVLNRMGVVSYYLQGGVAGYQKYLEGLLLSWKSRDSRMKTVGNCKPCGEKNDVE